MFIRAIEQKNLGVSYRVLKKVYKVCGETFEVINNVAVYRHKSYELLTSVI